MGKDEILKELEPIIDEYQNSSVKEKMSFLDFACRCHSENSLNIFRKMVLAESEREVNGFLKQVVQMKGIKSIETNTFNPMTKKKSVTIKVCLFTFSSENYDKICEFFENNKCYDYTLIQEAR